MDKKEFIKRYMSGEPVDSIVSMGSSIYSNVPQGDIEYNTSKEITPQNIYNKVKTLPWEIVENLPVAGETLGGVMGQSFGGTKGGTIGGMAGAGAGKYLQQQIEKNPMQATRVIDPLFPLMGSMPNRQILPTQAGEIKEIFNTAKNAGVRDLVMSGLFGISKGILRLVPAQKLSFINKVRKGFWDSKRAYGKRFGDSVDALSKKNPNLKIDLSDEVNVLKNSLDPQNLELNSRIMGTIKSGEREVGSNIMSNLIENPDYARNLSLEEASRVKRIIQKSRNISRGYKTGEFQPGDLEVLEFLDNVDKKILDTFPKMAKYNKEYSTAMKQWDNFKKYLRMGQTSGAMDTAGKGMREIEIWRNNILPFLKDNPKLKQALSEYFSATSIGGLTKNLAGLGMASYALKQLNKLGE